MAETIYKHLVMLGIAGMLAFLRGYDMSPSSVPADVAFAMAGVSLPS